MLGASKNSYTALIKEVDSNKGIQSFNDAKSLLAAAKLIATNKSLLNTLTDSGLSIEEDQVSPKICYHKSVQNQRLN